SLGLGLAAPFIAVALMPAAARLIPRPGAWMNVMKQVLGFALLLTALWLVWLFGRLTGLDGVTGLLGFLIALSFGAYLYGSVQYRGPGALKRGALAVALVAVAAGGWLGISDVDAKVESSRAQNDGKIGWQAWSPATIEEALSEGRPVFVNFTADWCLTCKVTEREVISTPEVIAAGAGANILWVEADLTHTDDVLVNELERFGRTGVPLYLLYYPDAPDDPEVLPQVITKNRLITAFKDLS
ncbi:MAG: protein-disulfide reductase DsbD family protein, partial [Bradymonadaceae bacterium]